MKLIKEFMSSGILEKKVPATPVSIQINLLNACYQKCIGCDKPNWPDIMLSSDRVVRLLNWMNTTGGESVVFSGGDPLAYRHLTKVFENIGNLKVGILTAGLWGKDCPIETVIAKSTYIKFSIDGASREVYRRARGVDTLEVVKRNVKFIKSRAQDLNPTIQLRCDATISQFNFHEITEILELCYDLGIEAYFFPIHTWPDLQLNNVTLASVAAEIERAMKSPVYSKMKTNVASFIDMQLRKKPPICVIPYVHFFCDVDGNLFVCCRAVNDNGKHEDRDMTAVLGNIYKKDVAEIWNSEEAQKIRDQIWNADRPYCQFCDRYNKVNVDFFNAMQSLTTPTFL